MSFSGACFHTDLCKSDRRKRVRAAGVQEAITLLEALPLTAWVLSR
jgi:hypothetical protein